jgi:hypothetical protein
MIMLKRAYEALDKEIEDLMNNKSDPLNLLIKEIK